MDISQVRVGSTITNGSSALRVTERVEKDPRWGVPSWRGMCIPLEAFGGNPGMTDTVPDYILGSWRPVPFEWAPVTGDALDERYVWTADWRRLQRELRPRELKVGDHVKMRDVEDEGVGIVRRVGPDGGVWVETLFNMWRNYPAEHFTWTGEELTVGVLP